ncbi:MAG: polyphenol oxidase family protein [Bacteroidales bacterium]|nr:polyphenol oxidase family protein [Bacteroidales bacterium]
MNILSQHSAIQLLQWRGDVNGAIAFNTLRQGATDGDPYSSLNLCDYTGDSPAHVEEGRRAVCAALGIAPDRLVMPRQTHTCCVAVVDEALMALPHPDRMARLQDVDALVTSLRGVCIGVNTADCVNIALVDEQAGVAGVAHAGWRGTAGKIAARTVEAMTALGAQPHRIKAVMGASICRACFEVGDEVVEAFEKEGFSAAEISQRNPATGKAHINLQHANALVLRAAGVAAGNITWNGECSRCKSERYFSARRLGIGSGRTFTGVMLKHGE